MKQSIRRTVLACSASSLALLACNAATAQTADNGSTPSAIPKSNEATTATPLAAASDPSAVKAQSQDNGTADIVVTAQRRSESINKVPIAITVVSGDQLKGMNATRLSDIQQFAPSVQFAETPSENTFQIRGIGTQSYDYSVEQAVGVALDDVNITLPRVSPFNTLADLDRVEVLRGPQGLLFGKNTTAGLISITTKRPEIGAYTNEGHLQYGSRDQVQAYDIVNIPVSDTVALRFRAAYQDQHDQIHSDGPTNLPDTRAYDLNGKLLWKPTERLSIYLIGDYQAGSEDGGVATVRSYDPNPGGTYAPGKTYGAPFGGPAAGGPNFVQLQNEALGITAGPNNRDVGIGGPSYTNTKFYGGQANIDYELAGGQTISYVGSYHKSSFNNGSDADLTPVPALDENLAHVRANQLTQEIRIASPTGSKLDYIGGLYYYRQIIDANQLQAGTLGLLPSTSAIIASPTLIGGQYNYHTNSKSYAIFTQLTYHLTDTLRLTAGARGTHDDISASTFTSAVANVCGAGYALLQNVAFCQIGGTLAAPVLGETLPTPVVGEQRKHNDYTARGGVEFDLNPRSMLYATISRGYKGAAVSTVSGAIRDVNPETVVAYEAGIKSSFFNRKLSVSADVFRSDFSDFQTEVFDPNVGLGAFITGNAPKLRTQGVEFEATARPFKGFALSGGLTYLDAKFRNYHPPCYSGQTAAEGCDYTTDPANPTFNAKGLRLTDAPKWAGTVNASYETLISQKLKASASVNWSYRSAVIFSVGDQGTRQGGYGVTNINVGVGDPDDHVRVSVFVRNLFDKRYAAAIFSSVFDAGGYNQVLPDNAFRRIGAALDWRF